MSADAKAWYDVDGRSWMASHDGPCRVDVIDHSDATTLSIALQRVEMCMGRELRWEFRQYPDGTIGLVGYHA